MFVYRAAVDIGGTFTDIVVSGNGAIYRSKVSSTPDDYSRGVIDGLLGLLASNGIGVNAVEAVLHGTTVGTNAILQETGARVGLLATRGFRDVLEIARLRRASLYNLAWRPPRPLVRRAWRLDLTERIDARGRVLVKLDEDEVLRHVEWLHGQGVEALAVALLNAHANPSHEAAVARLVRKTHPDLPISVSSELSPVIREYERTSTAVVNAYIQPIVTRYLRRPEAGLRGAGIGGRLWVMQSNGGLLGVGEACRAPVLLIESGPAAGVRGAEAWAAEAGNANVIALDVGGTTAKAALLEEGRASMAATLEVGAGMNAGNRLLRGVGYPINVASYDLAEVSAGGGSTAWVDGAGALCVGPRSAGADPGPACYGRGGIEPTLTDAFLVLGYLNADGIGGRPLDVRLAEAAIADRIARPLGLTLHDAAYGIYEVAKTKMIGALKAVSTERGRNPAEFSLLAFGGGGPVLAHALAQALGSSKVVIPAAPGLYSAVGMLLADARRNAAATLLRPLDTVDAAALEGIYQTLETRARAAMAADGFDLGAVTLGRSAELHFAGQDFELAVSVPPGPLGPNIRTEIAEAFGREHELAFGHRNEGERIVLVNARVNASAPLAGPAYREPGGMPATPPPPERRRTAYFGFQHGLCDAHILRDRAAVGTGFRGPAIIEEDDTTIVIPPGWQASLEPGMSLVLSACEGAGETAWPAPRQHGVITSELIRLALLSTTDEMALALTRAAYSIGIRDIMDFGTALCDGEGQLVAQSQTLAIHLGAVPPAVTSVRERFANDLQPGDVVILNDPYRGGMHLADVFMIQPIFVDGRLSAYAVVTAHQVDMGGSVPGGNAASLKSIYEEGLRIPPMKLIAGGRINETLMAMIRRNVRMPRQVVGDFRAMGSACNIAAIGIAALARKYGPSALARAMEETLAHAERLARAEIQQLPRGTFVFEDFMDDDGVSDIPVRVAVSCTVTEGKVRVDFAGTSPQVRGAGNATLSVAQSAAYFALRCAMSADVPVNAGYYRLVEVTAPAGSVVNPRFPASCAAKGVTAFRVCDAMLGALGRMLPGRMPAAGEGGATIVTFAGSDEDGKPFVLMDLVLGGMGGGPGWDGAEGVANASCNVRNTPVEIIEAGFPVRVERYGFVADTGGPGQFRGALSICREYRFLGEAGVLQVRADRHHHPPYGVAGGAKGTPSRNALRRDGNETTLASKFVIPVRADDLFCHVQAGAGGYGPASLRSAERIMADLADGKISIDYARRAYGWAS